MAISTFVELCNNQFKKKKGSIIGLCCSTGGNISGFFFVSFMCHNFYSINDSIELFGKTRPPGITNKKFVEFLHKEFPPFWNKNNDCISRMYKHDIYDNLEETHDSTRLYSPLNYDCFEQICISSWKSNQLYSLVYDFCDLSVKYIHVDKYSELCSCGWLASKRLGLNYRNLERLSDRFYATVIPVGIRIIFVIDNAGEMYIFSRDDQNWYALNKQFFRKLVTKDKLLSNCLLEAVG